MCSIILYYLWYMYYVHVGECVGVCMGVCECMCVCVWACRWCSLNPVKPCQLVSNQNYAIGGYPPTGELVTSLWHHFLNTNIMLNLCDTAVSTVEPLYCGHLGTW